MPTFTENEYKEFGKAFLEKYLSLGFGILSKKETESLIFSIIEKSASLKGKRNYDLANELKITEAKLKNLRLDAAMRFATPNQKASLGNIVQNLLDQNMIPSLKAGNIELLLENPVEKREYEYAVKLAGQHIEYGRNREIVITTPAMLLEVIIANAEQGQKHFKELVQAHISDTKKQKEVLNAALTIGQRIALFGEQLANPSTVKAIFSTAKGWLSGGA